MFLNPLKMKKNKEFFKICLHHIDIQINHENSSEITNDY